MRFSTKVNGYSRSLVDSSQNFYLYLAVSFRSKMYGTGEAMSNNACSNGSIQNVNGSLEEKLDELRQLMRKVDGDPLRIVGVGAGAWGSVFTAMLQEAYGSLREKVLIRIWRRPGRTVDRATAKHLFEVINSREDVLRRLIRRCAYLKYVEGRLGDRVLYADEILKDGFCLNMIDTPLCPLKVVTNLQEAVWDADIVINGLPSTETREVFEEISKYWKERITVPVIISLAKGVEAELGPEPRIITPTLMINRATGVPIENILYLGGPNIASEIYNKEYANARICGAEKWRKPLAKFLRQPHFIVWDNGDLVTHEVMGGLKNVYAIGAEFVLMTFDFTGMVAALTNESATSKSVYFAHCTSEMIFITHLLAEEPERLAGPLLADTYVTLLKGRNAWYGQKLAKGELSLEMGDSIKGKGMIQGVSAVKAFYELLSQSSLNVLNPDENKHVAPVELCPILKMLYKILIIRESPVQAILQALRDETMNDPRDRIEIAQSHVFYRPSLLGHRP
ncbi:probable glycerol-3-phosphate dehydrogenase [NAD(+)] 1, cytosolic isoform X1 [Abrus precatorius]|uniref:Glycerol-3-phosphate dehydrogenase [NAD(+)] n=1 Tax=Abrus precatorius TaxID=3816 RepID=A0A8B8LJV9_ABRPR|nr:probable glycerol-3-phosphate dehydrogenase [NAD(+)] 1, cytosolic isoform X1 [Abrus precatorius]